MRNIRTSFSIHGAEKITITPSVKASKNVSWITIDVESKNPRDNCDIIIFGDVLQLPKIAILPTDVIPADETSKADAEMRGLGEIKGGKDGN